MGTPSTRAPRAGRRSGASSGASVEVVGLREFRRDLRSLGNARELSRELGRETRYIAKQAAGWAQAEARSMGGPWRHFAGDIKGAGGVAGARVAIDSEANTVFWGAKKRTGWNAGHGGRPQHPAWIGNMWDAGVAGQGPYAINQALADHTDDIVDAYSAALDRIASKAFPDR